MKSLHLLFASALIALSPACKKESESGTASGSRSPSPTKAAARSQEEPSASGDKRERTAAPVESREAADLIEAAEAAQAKRQDFTAQLSAATLEESLTNSLDDAEAIAKAQEKASDAAKQAKDLERAYVKTIDALRTRQAKDPEDSIAAYLAYATQRDLVAAKQREIEADPPDSEEAMKLLEEELMAEAAKLRELRAAWKGDEPSE